MIRDLIINVLNFPVFHRVYEMPEACADEPGFLQLVEERLEA